MSVKIRVSLVAGFPRLIIYCEIKIKNRKNTTYADVDLTVLRPDVKSCFISVINEMPNKVFSSFSLLSLSLRTSLKVPISS